MARSRHYRQPNPAGFTLVEVLVALAILAIALAAVVRVTTQAVDLTADLRDRSVALGVAQDRLVMHQLQRSWPAAETRSGKRTQDGREWYWTEQVQTTPVPTFRRIEIEVREREGGRVVAHLVGFLRKTT